MNATAEHSSADDCVETAASAWVLEVADNIRVAISQHEMNHIDECSNLIKIPKAPVWCDQVMLWKNQIVPVMDFVRIYDPEYQSNGVAGASIMVAIVRVYDNSEQKISYGAIRILQPPILEKISNKQASKKQDIDQRWNGISVSAFNHKQTIVPVLDIKSLFGGSLER